MAKGSGVKGSPTIFEKEKYFMEDNLVKGNREEIALNFSGCTKLSLEQLKVELKKYMSEIVNDSFYSDKISFNGRDSDENGRAINAKYKSPLGLIIVDKNDVWEYDTHSSGVAHIPMIGNIELPSIFGSVSYLEQLLYAHGIEIDLGLGSQSNYYYNDVYSPKKRKFEQNYKNGKELIEYWDSLGRKGRHDFIYSK